MKTIFVSSTFKDMQFERDAIQEITKPMLNREAQKYGQQVSFCDLRWGINTAELDSEQSSKKVLDVCLDEIDRSQPPMVVLLGYRYGWIPPKSLMESVVKKKSLILEDLEKSVTALEIEYGALASKTKLDNTLFYFRDIEGDFPSEYAVEDELHKLKMNELKEKIRKLSRGQVKEYTARYSEGKLQGIREFAEMLAEDLKEKLTPSWETYASLLPAEKEAASHWSYIENKNAMFRANRGFAEYLFNEITSGRRYTVIRGETGSGKSTLFSKLAVMLRNKDYTVLPYVCGITTESSTSLGILKSINLYLETVVVQKENWDTSLLNLQFDNSPYIHGKVNIINETNREQIEATDRFKKLCHIIRNNGENIVVMIDGLDQLLNNDNKSLLFNILSQQKNVQVIMSYLNSYNPDLPRSVQRIWNDACLDMPEMSDDDKIETINGICGSNSRELSPNVVATMVAKANARTPLYLSLLVQRLLIMNRDDFKEINERGSGIEAIIEHQIETIKECPDDLYEMHTLLLDEAGSRINKDLVSKVAQYIAVSRFGFRTSDLDALLGDSWNALDFSHFISYMPENFILHNDGTYDFAHKSIRQGYLARLSSSEKSELYKEVFNYLKALDDRDPVRRSEFIYFAMLADEPDCFIRNISQQEKVSADIIGTCIEFARNDDGAWLCNLLMNHVDEQYYKPIFEFITRLTSRIRGDTTANGLLIQKLLDASQKIALELTLKQYDETYTGTSKRTGSPVQDLVLLYSHNFQLREGKAARDSILQIYKKCVEFCREEAANNPCKETYAKLAKQYLNMGILLKDYENSPAETVEIFLKYADIVRQWHIYEDHNSLNLRDYQYPTGEVKQQDLSLQKGIYLPLLYLWIGKLYLQLQDLESAQNVYAKAYENIYGKHSIDNAELAYLCEWIGRDYESLGWGDIADASYSNAADYYIKAAKAGRNDLYYNAAEMLEKVGDRKEALSFCQKGVSKLKSRVNKKSKADELLELIKLYIKILDILFIAKRYFKINSVYLKITRIFKSLIENKSNTDEYRKEKNKYLYLYSLFVFRTVGCYEEHGIKFLATEYTPLLPVINEFAEMLTDSEPQTSPNRAWELRIEAEALIRLLQISVLKENSNPDLSETIVQKVAERLPKLLDHTPMNKLFGLMEEILPNPTVYSATALKLVEACERVMSGKQKVSNYFIISFKGLYSEIARLYEKDYEVYKVISYLEKEVSLAQRAIEDYRIPGALSLVAEAKEKLAAYQTRVGGFESANYTYNEALNIRTSILDEVGTYTAAISVADTYEKISASYYPQNKYELTGEYYEKALKLRKEIMEKYDSVDIAVKLAEMYENYGGYFFAVDELDTALSYYLQSVEYAKVVIQKIDLIKTHEILIDVYDKLGDIYRCKGDRENAALMVKRMVEAAVSAAEKATDMDSYGPLAKAYLKAGYVSNNLNYKKRALAMYEVMAKNDPTYVGVVNDIQKMISTYEAFVEEQ